MALRDNKEIEQEVEELNKIKPMVPEHSLFGDSNHEKIEAQIKTLEDFTDEDEIYEEYNSNYDADDEDDHDPEDDEQEVINNALDALRWKFGESEEKPSEAWKELIS